MKKETLYEALGDMDEAIILEAHAKKTHPTLRKCGAWGAFAACLAVIAVVASMYLPIKESPAQPDVTIDTAPSSELATSYSEVYLYSVDDGAFATYIGGKVIEETKIGRKIEDVTLTAGWKTGEGEWLTTEHLRGEIHLIEGISQEVAVALKFLDKGDALTTTHYYTLLNPEADLTEVQEYCIHIHFSAGSELPQTANSTTEGVTEIEIVEVVTSEATE